MIKKLLEFLGISKKEILPKEDLPEYGELIYVIDCQPGSWAYKDDFYWTTRIFLRIDKDNRIICVDWRDQEKFRAGEKDYGESPWQCYRRIKS